MWAIFIFSMILSSHPPFYLPSAILLIMLTLYQTLLKITNDSLLEKPKQQCLGYEKFLIRYSFLKFSSAFVSTFLLKSPSKSLTFLSLFFYFQVLRRVIQSSQPLAHFHVHSLLRISFPMPSPFRLLFHSASLSIYLNCIPHCLQIVSYEAFIFSNQFSKPAIWLLLCFFHFLCLLDIDTIHIDMQKLLFPNLTDLQIVPFVL